MSAIEDFEAAEKSNPALKAYYDNKRLFYINVFWMVIGGAAAALGVNTASTVMPLHMAKIGLDAEQISNVMSVRGYLTLPLALYLAQLSDRWQSKMGRRLPFLAASIPFVVVGMWLFPYTGTLLSCILVFAMFHFAMNIKYDTYPFIAYDIARKAYWGRVNGLTVVFAGVSTWIGQIVLLPMMDTRGEKYVYLLGALIVGTASVLTVIFSKEPPIRSETPPQFNPVAVIKHVLKVGFSSKSNIRLFIANGFLCGGVGLVGQYVSLQAMVNLHLTRGAIGQDVLQYGTIASTALAFFLGWGIDKLGSKKAIIVGFLLLVIASVLGFKPSGASQLAIANVFLTLSFTLVFWAQHVYTASLVRREDLATFGTCNGAVFVLILTIATQISGIMIKRVFGGNYGCSFIIAIAFATVGLILFFWVDRLRKHERVNSSITPTDDGATPNIHDPQAVVPDTRPVV